MKKLILLLVAFSIYDAPKAQNELMTEYAGTITQEELTEMLTIIASDALEGRNTGDRGQKMAAAFIADHFEQIGLEAVVPVAGGLSYFQKFNLEKSEPGQTYLEMGDEKLMNGTNVLYYGKYNASTPTTTELVFVADGSAETFGKLDVAGKAVLADGSDMSFAVWREISARTYEHGAEMLLLVNADTDKKSKSWIERYGSFFLRGSLGFKKEDEENEGKGLFIIPPSVAARLLNTTTEDLTEAKKLAAEGDLSALKKIKPVKVTYFTERLISTVETENVLGYLEGSDKKDELIIITAHYDHVGKRGEDIYNGADDDGSGTTSVMEIAEAFAEAKKAGHGPRRSMLFMTVTGEEKGLLGSEYYTRNPVFPLENTVVDLNIDMVGRTDEAHADDREFVYLVGADRLSSELHELSEKVNDTFTQLSLDYTYNDEKHPDRIYYRSDHWNFAKNNVPIIFYFNGTHEDYHQPTDTVDKIEFDLLQKRAQLVFYTAWVIANRESRLVIDKITEEHLTESH
jgi:hypothetical protein